MNLPANIKRFIPFIVSLGMFMEHIDTTIINTAIPAMSKSLAVNPIDLKIALISYLLSLAIFIPISGWLADKFGIKKIFMFALSLFTLSSLACGFAHNLWQLVAARTFQGLGGSLMVPVGRLMIVVWFERHEFIQTMSKVLLAALLGPLLGPMVGGWITDTFSWRWIFWVNIPFGCLALFLTFYLLPEYRKEKVHALDKIGFLLFGVGLAGFTFGLSSLSEEAMNPTFNFCIIFASLLSLGVYYLHAKHQTFPLLQTQLFRWRTFRLSILGNLLTRIGFGATPFLLPLMLQISLGYSAFSAGTLVASLAIGAMIVKSIAKPIIKFVEFKRLLIINTTLMGVCLLLFTLITPNTSHFMIAFYILIYGFFMSLQFSAMNSLAYAQTTPDELSNATSIHGMTIQISQSISVAICALLLKLMHTSSSQKILSLSDFHKTFLMVGFFTILCSCLFYFLKKEDGLNLIK